MAIKSPFSNIDSLSSDEQPIKPVIPVAHANLYTSLQSYAANIDADNSMYSQNSSIQASKSEIISKQAKLLTSRVRAIDGYSRNLADTTQKDNFEDTVTYIQGELSRTKSGFNSIISAVDAFLVFPRSIMTEMVAYVDGDPIENSIPVQATVTLFDSPNTKTQAVSATIKVANYYIVDYRWAIDDSTGKWYNSLDNNPFPVVAGSKILLAYRVRITRGGSLLGSDWKLKYSYDGSTWADVGSGEDITFVESDYFPIPALDEFSNFSYKAFVTRPGPGNPLLSSGIYTETEDDQSPRLTVAVKDDTEVEVWSSLSIDSNAIGENIYLSIESNNLVDYGTDVTVQYKLLKQPWLTNIVSP